jgi:periplasmic divalent cation tolerance protein
MLIVLTTVSTSSDGEKLGRKIVEAKLAACVQILPQMTSVYFWEGTVQTEPEHLLLIKAAEEKFDSLSSFIKEHHSYDVPEILAIQAPKVSDNYLDWVRSVMS